MVRRRALAARCAALFALLFALAPVPASAARCDRDCLAGLVTRYVDALVAHDPSRLPLARGEVRFTEDSRELKLGEGAWRTITGKGRFRQDYLDVGRQIAASHVDFLEGQTPVLYSLLLHVKNGRIGGIETLVQRVTPEAHFQPTELGKPLAGMNDPVPAGQRQPRVAMIRTALKYTEGLRVGSFAEAGTPFAPEAYRVENGFFVTGAGCPRPDCTGIATQKIIRHPDIRASVAAVDEDKGIVLLWMNFGNTNSYGPGNALVTFEAFKAWGGQIHAINAFFHPLPADTQRNWPPSDPLPAH